jgi:hypothetical protein
MATYTIKDIPSSTDRHKLFALMCSPIDLFRYISYVQSEKINVINIGKELARYIDNLEDYRYLPIDLYDYTKQISDNHKNKIDGIGNDVIAIYNLGILLEPDLRLNAIKILKEFSKTAALIIIWENQFELPDRLYWATQQHNVFLDFSASQLKIVHYEI